MADSQLAKDKLKLNDSSRCTVLIVPHYYHETATDACATILQPCLRLRLLLLLLAQLSHTCGFDSKLKTVRQRQTVAATLTMESGYYVRYGLGHVRV